MKGNIGYNVLVKQIQYLFICFKRTDDEYQ